jgi:hypothetical protein
MLGFFTFRTHKMTDRVILVIGTEGNEESATSQKTLVGIAGNDTEAQELVGKDYLALCNTAGLNPLINPAYPLYDDGDSGSADPSDPEGISAFTTPRQVTGYTITGYTWNFVKVPVGQLVNFTL